MSFYIRIDEVCAAKSPATGIAFELTLDNRVARKATILSYDFELWLLGDIKATKYEFLIPLRLDLHAQLEAEFGPHDQKPFRLLWHYTPSQLQQVEDTRKGSDPALEIRGHFHVMSVWTPKDGSAQPPKFVWERPYHATKPTGGSYPIRFSVPHSDWTALLNEIGFKHIALYELPMPSFPPGFSRSESHLKEAWEHHWAGRRNEAMLACHKAFECLGFNLFAEDKLRRSVVLERLMEDAPEAKRTTVVKLWDSIQDLFHLGRHERAHPIKLTHADTEMALVCATALLGYLTKLG